MRLFALLATCVLYAHAATISAPPKKIDDLDDVDLDNVVSEPELINPFNSIKDVDNNLRNSLGIPVKVIEEPAKKLDENSNDYVPNNDDSINLKRAPIDLRNPGPPQRQEHETQNPEHYSDAQKAIFAIKQTIDDTQNVFTQGLKGISEGFNKLFANNEQLSTIQQNILTLRSTFSEQVSKLNNTIKSYIKPEKEEESAKEINAVQNRLRLLENNFETGVNTLSEGVELLAIIKEEDDAAAAKAEGDAVAATGTTSAPTSTTQAPVGPVLQFLYNFQQGILGSLSNVNNAVQNYWNQGQNQQNQQPPQNDQAQQAQPTNNQGSFIGNLFQGIQLPFTGQQNQQPAQQGQNQEKPPGAAADEPAQTGWRPPNIIQSIQNSWNNLVNPNQNQPQADTPNNPNPIQQAFNNIANVFNRPPNQTPQNAGQAVPPASGNSVPAAVNTAEKPADQLQGVNAVPPKQESVPAEAAQVQPEKVQDQAQPEKVPVQEPTKQTGPIQQLVQNNPIIKGLQTVAQRISNPERPRDTVKENTDGKGHGGWGHDGDNSDGSRIKSVAPEKEIIEEKPVECNKMKETVKEKEISSEPAKTE
ncbi:20-hydroxyecdysone protein [Colias croceus]|uniref:20-hydroxyecdysone protein n=1 Tax=Colias crocea TaxID=72248 RepID=UPI001E27AF36|nr:20-hydroxyecdysone protein [Colias croceus]